MPGPLSFAAARGRSVVGQDDGSVFHTIHAGQGLHPEAHAAQDPAAVLHGFFDGHRHAGHLGPGLGDDLRQAQDGLAVGQDVVHQQYPVVLLQIPLGDPQGVGLLQGEGVGLGGVDLRSMYPV